MRTRGSSASSLSGGLVVDYLGLAGELRQALATYTEAGGTGKAALDQAEAVAVMLEKYEVCTGGWRCPTGRRCASATTWASSRRCARTGAEVRGMPQRNLAVELLQKLLKGEIRVRRKRNVVQARSFAELLEQALLRYQNRAVETAQVIEELIALAREMRAEEMRAAVALGEELGLSEDKLAFYDALETNDSAVAVLGDETLKMIARELVATVRKNAIIDWTVRENVRAGLRVYVKRTLRKPSTLRTSSSPVSSTRPRARRSSAK